MKGDTRVTNEVHFAESGKPFCVRNRARAVPNIPEDKYREFVWEIIRSVQGEAAQRKKKSIQRKRNSINPIKAQTEKMKMPFLILESTKRSTMQEIMRVIKSSAKTVKKFIFFFLFKKN